MRVGALLDVGVNAVLGLALVLVAAGVLDQSRAPRLELGRVHLTRLEDATLKRLASLRDRVEITYYVSSVDRMPSHMRRVERDVTDLLSALATASNGRLHYQIVDPDGNQDLIDFAARRRVTPVRVRQVSRDSWTEQEVWSTLTIAYGPRPPAVIRGVGPEHIPRLQQLLVAHLDALEVPVEPVFAFSAPSGHEKLRALLESRGRVIDVDPSSGQPLPEQADLLIWLAPGRVSPDCLRELDRFLDRGRSLIVAGAEARPQLVGPSPDESLALIPTGFDAVTLFGHFGLRPASGLLLDERSRDLDRGEDQPKTPAPYRITCIANNQDFQQLAYDCNATLLFEAPSALHSDAEALAERGWRADVLATSSERAWARPWTGQPIPLSELPAKTDDRRPKEPLVVWLRHVDPWRGQVLAIAADTPFTDDHFDLSGTGHSKLMRVLLDTLGAPDRIVQGRAEIQRVAPLPPLDPTVRGLWRAFAVLLLPLGLALLWLGRRRGERVARAAARRGGVRWGDLAWRGVLGGAAVLGLSGLLPGRLDLTADGHNLLHPETLAAARQAAGSGDVRLELIFSASSRLPPDLRQPVRRLTDLVADLTHSVPGLDMLRVHPEELSEARRQELAKAGVEPLAMASHDEESTTVRTVWSALRLVSGERQELLRFDDTDAFEQMEFRLAFALWRLATGRHPRVVVASDNPRLSAAEAHEEFQKKGLIAPTGTDTYALARQALERVDFDVLRVDPRQPRIDGSPDALIWFQPRRPVVPMLNLLIDHLYRGGHALVAAQHFNIQARQYRGRGFDFVYWPQPQSPDIDQFWLPDLGIRLVREVLFDQLSLPIDDQAQIAGSERRDFKRMRSSLPFVIRAVGGHFADDSTITRGLGDQAFIWGSYLQLDEPRLAELGLTAKTLITTSEHAWSYDWSGGWIPDELLDGPPSGEDGRPRWLGRVPLALDVSGSFPWPELSFDQRGLAEGEAPRPYERPEPMDVAAPGRLVLLGDSELFKNKRMVDLRPEFRSDQLLLNSVAELALPPGLSEVMARRSVPRGFGVVAESTRLRWRAVVLLGVPLLLLAAGLMSRLIAGGA